MRKAALQIFKRDWRVETQQHARLATTLPQQQSIVILPEVVQKLAAKTISIDDSKLPAPVMEAVEAAVADKGAKNLRRKWQALKEAYRLLSSSRHRGGEQPNFVEAKEIDDPNATLYFQYRKRGKDRQRERRSLGQLTHHVPLAGHTSPESNDPELIGLDDYLVTMQPELEGIKAKDESVRSVNERMEKNRALRGLYDETGALAYAATHMKGKFATLVRVFREIAHAAGSSWSPQSLLDFGSGPGTAFWAAESVWRSGLGHSPLHAVAVEPSTQMTHLGATMRDFNGRHQNFDHMSSANQNHFGIVKWMSRLPNSATQYDLVVASHVLGEILNDKERDGIVERLWQHTTKYLVIVEPGTPAGFSRVQKARSLVLNSDRGDGAHVVAPCPHDGVCPLLGRQTWCHFVQRYHVDSLHRRISSSGTNPSQKMPSAGLSYKDEHFSYVVLRRGPRASMHTDSDVTLEVLHTQTEASKRKPPFSSTHSSLQQNDASLRNKNLKPRVGVPLIELEDEDRERVEATMREMILESLNNQLTDDEMETELPPELEEELRQFMDAAAALSDVNADDLTNSSDDEGYSSSSSSSDSEEGVGEELSEDSEAEDCLKSAGMLGSDQNDDTSHIAIDQKGHRRRVSTCDDDIINHAVNTANDEEDKENLMHAASTEWSRILRAPRKRPGHVVLDVCSAMDEEGKYLGGKKGAILRQIVSRSHSVHVIGGSEPYKMAKSSRWGDVWPAFYQNTFRKVRIE